jgi:hypothetical protein
MTAKEFEKKCINGLVVGLQRTVHDGFAVGLAWIQPTPTSVQIEYLGKDRTNLSQDDAPDVANVFDCKTSLVLAVWLR